MKTRILIWTTALSVFAGLALPAGLAAQTDNKNGKPEHRRYKVIDTGTLGGPSSFLGFEQSRNINNHGVLAAATDIRAPLVSGLAFNGLIDPVTEQPELDRVLTIRASAITDTQKQFPSEPAFDPRKRRMTPCVRTSARRLSTDFSENPWDFLGFSR